MKRARKRLGLLLVLGMLTAGLPIGAVAPASAASPGDLVINEILQNPSAVSDSNGEWLELFNPTGSAVDIDGWTIKDDDFDSHEISNGGPLLVPAGGYLVLGTNADSSTNGGVTVGYEYSNTFLGNGADEVVLLDGVTEIDRVNYDGGTLWPDPTGASMSLRDPSLDNSLGVNWCTANTLFNATDFGTPGAANECPPPAAPELVINEIIQNPSAVSDANGEWLELFNPNTTDIDIDGWTIADNDFDSHVITNGGPLVVPAGGYAVLGNNADVATNGGVAVQYEYNGIALANGADEVVLIDTNGAESDRVEYDGGAVWPDPTGASMALIDAALDNNVGTSWCIASTLFNATDFGTPGAANDCPAPEAPALVINEIMQNPSAVSDSNGEWFELYNPNDTNVDIDGWTIADNDIDSHVIANGGPLVIPAGGYAVLGNNADSAANGGVALQYEYTGWFLSNGADEVVILDRTLTEIDRVEYDGGTAWPDPTGASMSLEDPLNDNNVGAAWCTSVTAFGAGDLGTPGAINVCTLPPQLVINEIMQNPSAVSDSAGEWFELHNPNDTDVDIDGWSLSDLGSNTHTIANGGPLVIAAGGYLVLGNNANAATNGGVSVDYQYSGFVLGNSDDEVVLADVKGIEVDRVEYDGGPAWPDPTGASMSLDNPVNDNNVGAYWCTASTPFGAGDFGTPGAVNDCPATLIHDIQGTTDTSPLLGLGVTIEGIVVGDFQDDVGANGDLNGFFVQEEDAQVDGDTATSEGIFVFDGFAPAVDVAVGDLVRVVGTVGEYQTDDSDGNVSHLTELASSAVVVLPYNNPLPAPTVVSLPALDADYLERYEGMSVTFGAAAPLVVTETFGFGRYGEVVLATDRQAQPTAIYEPGSPAAAGLTAANQLARITLDDGRTGENLDPVRHPNGSSYNPDILTLRGGDEVSSIGGVLSDAFGLYRIQPTAPASFNQTNPRQGAPDLVGGSLKVASFNVLNYFTTLDYPFGDPLDNMCGPLMNQGCRGADTADELARQRAKIISALAAMDADVVGLIEIENYHATNGDVPLADLVAGVNDAMGAGTYAYVDTGPIGGDAIKVALIYKPAAVALSGGYSILDSTVDSRFDDDKNRPALAQTFTENSTGESFTVAVNHLKSKGSPCGPGDDDPEQGSCNLTRTLAAQALVDWLGSGFDNDVLIIGDLNSYDKEDPIDAVVAAGYSDLVAEYLGEYAYSYVFKGQWGYLDYAMANPSMASAVTGTTVWHINSDEPPALDYNNYNQPSLYDPDPFRASDHDPVIVGLDLAQPQVDKGRVRDALEGLLPDSDKNTTKRLEKAIDAIDASLDPGWWIDDQTITSKKVFDQERNAVVQLELIVASGVPEAGSAQHAIDVLVNADRQLARIAIIAATNAGGDPIKLAEAEVAMAEAAAYVTAGLYNEAINAYKVAWDKANKA